MATAIRKITLSASRDIPFNKPSPAAVAQAVDCEASTLSPTDALAAAPDGRTVLQLQDGLELARAKVIAQFRIKVSGFTDDMVDRLKAIGLISEIISWKLRLFVPTDASGPSILAKVVERHPLVRVAHKTAG
jgi:hypothetical protein